MTSLIDDIKRDRESGTPGPWREGASDFYPGLDGPLTTRVYTDFPPEEIDVSGDRCRTNARRIARVPEMEAKILRDAEIKAAAEKLAEAVCHAREMVCQDLYLQMQVEDAVDAALAAYRAATGESDA